MLGTEELPGDFLLEEIGAEVNSGEELQAEGGGQFVHAFAQAQGRAHGFGVHHQLFGGMAVEEIQHARAGDHADSGQGGQHGTDAAFQTRLGVHQLGVAGGQIGVGGQTQRTPHLCVGRVHHGGFHRAHGGGAVAHVKNGRGAAPYDGRARGRALVQGDARQTFGGMLHHAAQQSDRAGAARQGHGNDLSGHARPRQINQALGSKGAVNQRRGGAHVKDGHRPLAQGLGPAAHARQKAQHALAALGGEGSRDHRLGGVQQHQVQAVQVADGHGDVGAHHRGGLGGKLRQPFGHLNDAQQVGALGGALAAGVGVQHVDRRRAGVKMHLVVPVGQARLAQQIVEGEAVRGALQTGADESLRQAHHLGVFVHGGPTAGQQGARLGQGDAHAGVRQQGKGLIQNARHLLRADQFKGGAAHAGCSASRRLRKSPISALRCASSPWGW